AARNRTQPVIAGWQSASGHLRGYAAAELKCIQKAAKRPRPGHAERRDCGDTLFSGQLPELDREAATVQLQIAGSDRAERRHRANARKSPGPLEPFQEDRPSRPEPAVGRQGMVVMMGGRVANDGEPVSVRYAKGGE